MGIFCCFEATIVSATVGDEAGSKDYPMHIPALVQGSEVC